jgi:hypothetical protein
LAKLIRRAENDFEEEHLGAADFCASATLRKWPSLNKEHHQPNQHRAARARNASITCSMAGFGGGARIQSDRLVGLRQAGSKSVRSICAASRYLGFSARICKT